VILLISACQVARITGVSDCRPAAISTFTSITVTTYDKCLSPKETSQEQRHCQVLVILVTQEAEIRRIGGSQPAQANGSWDPISKILNTKKGWKNGSSGTVPA
jgi:hypothetical protein